MKQTPENRYSSQHNKVAAIWFCHVLLVAGSLLLSGIYYPTTIHYTFPFMQVMLLLIAAIISAAVSLRQVEFLGVERRDIYFVLPALLFFAVVMPWPYRLIGLLLIAGLLLTIAPRIQKIFHPLANGILFTGMILAAQAVILPAFYLIFSRYHRLDFATPILATIMKAAGVETHANAGALFLREGDKVFSFLTTWDALGLYPILSIWIGGLITIWLFRERRQKLLYLTGILLGYMFLRYAAAIFFFLNLQNAAVLWKFEYTFLTLLPLGLILSKTIPLQINMIPAPPVQPAGKKTAGAEKNRLFPAFLAASLLLFSLIGLWGFHDPGVKKAGRILIDEKHSNWEWTTEEFDTKWYGQKSTYNYYSLFEHLRRFYEVSPSHAILSDSLLQHCDVLILKTPTEPFTEKEIDAVVGFVRQGGGLFLIGDHTNVFGITTNLNPLAQRFGLKFRYDFQSDITGELSVYRPPKILPHPVVQHMPAFMFASGCMMEAPLTAENVIIGYGQRSLYLDYAEKNFFPRDKTNEETMEFGLFLQAAGVRFGQGRVLGFTDSTVWSNFYMHIPGKPELLLGCIEWLNRQNSWWGILRSVFLALAIFSLAFVVWAGTKISRVEFLWMAIFAIALGLPISTTVFGLINRASYPLSQPKRDFIQVNFETEHSHYELPILHMTENAAHSFHTFYLWLQRLGMAPAVKTKFSEALVDGDAVVLINPHRPFSKTELQQFENYLTGGGKALILSDPRQHSSAHQLLDMFGMSLNPIWSDSATFSVQYHGNDSIKFFGELSGEVKGGTPVIFAETRAPNVSKPLQSIFPQQTKISINQTLPAGESLDLPSNHPNNGVVRKPVLSVQNVGKGSLAVMSCSALFTDREMGSNSIQPSPNMQKIYDLEFWIFSELLQLGSRQVLAENKP